MNISRDIFIATIQKTHPELTEQDLFVKGKQLSVKGFALLLAHFNTSLKKTGKPQYKGITKNEVLLLCEYLQKINYISMFFVDRYNVFLAGPIDEVARLSNKTFQDFIAQLKMFDKFEVHLIDDVQKTRTECEKPIFIVPYQDKPFASYSIAMAKRKARRYDSYIIIAEPSKCERFNKSSIDEKITNVSALLNCITYNNVRDDGINNLYAEYTLDEHSSLTIPQQKELIETFYDEVILLNPIKIGKIVFHLKMTIWHDHYNVTIQYNKEGKQIIKEEVDETNCKAK